MPGKFASAKALEDAITKLHQERQTHLKAIEKIDALFDKLGIVSSSNKKTATFSPIKGGATRRRRSHRFEISGTASILAFVKKGGPKGVPSSAIVKHWKSEGRAGDGYTTLGQLVKAKKLKKQNIKGQKGSVYTAC